jgi:hypothetical protein
MQQNDTAWDGTPLTPWPRGWQMLNPLAWISTAYERADLLNAPPGFSETDRARIIAAGGLVAIHDRRRRDDVDLRTRHDDEIRVAQLLGYSTQRLRGLALAQRMECERIAYHLDAMRTEPSARPLPPERYLIDFRRERT